MLGREPTDTGVRPRLRGAPDGIAGLPEAWPVIDMF
jgi:hypothetical protein